MSGSQSASNKYDTIIVGAGLSGGVVADRLTAAGHRCLMLEAGKRFETADFPIPPLEQGQLFWNQGMEFTADGRLFILRGKCVGGSSVVNQALLDRLPPDALDRWFDKTNTPFFDPSTFNGHYDRLLSSGDFQHAIIPSTRRNRNAQIFADGMERNGWKTKNLHRAQADCHWDDGQNCIDCLGGCPRNSKQSALITSLLRAESRGLEILSNTQVERVERSADEITVYTGSRHPRRKFVAKSIVLAAGSMGTPEILLRSGFQRQVRMIGEGFYVHPQFNVWGRFDEEIDPHVGAFQAIASDEKSFAKRGFKLESVAIPPAVMSLATSFGDFDDTHIPDYRHWACIESSIRDEEPGRLRVGMFKSTRIDKKLSPADLEKRQVAQKTMEEVLRAAGASRTVSAWLGFSVHPMGGCSIGADPTTSCVDPEFRLHGAKNIYVADASLFPDAPGCNPSLTVMALAHGAADSMLGMA